MADESNGMARRKAPRYGCAGDAEIVLPGRGLHFKGKIGDLSIGGCFIEAHCKLERGTSVELWMNAQGQPLRVAANLLEWREQGAGFRFHSLTPRKKEQICGLIAELAEELAERERAKHASEGEPQQSEAEEEPARCGDPEAWPAVRRSRWARLMESVARRLRRRTWRDENAA